MGWPNKSYTSSDTILGFYIENNLSKQNRFPICKVRDICHLSHGMMDSQHDPLTFTVILMPSIMQATNFMIKLIMKSIADPSRAFSLFTDIL